MSEPFIRAILHDPDAPAWYAYTEPVQSYVCSTPDTVVPTLDALEAAVEEDRCFAVGYVSYEAAQAFDPTYATHPRGRLPFVAFTTYRRREEFAFTRGEDPGVNWQESEPEAIYRQRFLALKEKIGGGEVYQVNYTSRLKGHCGEPFDLFRAIGAGARYGAYLETRDYAIVSASPELFFKLDGARVTSMPMKGTWPRANSACEDAAAGAALAASEKNRAENLMITDMVRNDLGRVAKPGSVEVTDLFAVNPYPSVWQMTSSVTAASDAGLTALFAALFPPASITGAPKHASMDIIQSLEPTPREIYTGTVGVMAPGRQYRFSVAIRTAWVNRADNEAEYGVGGGIVWDSNVDEEMTERRDKARILQPLPKFDLLETMRVERGSIARCEAHMYRLGQSAAYFHFPFDRDKVLETLNAVVARLPDAPHRLRLTLSANGEADVTTAALSEDPDWQPVMLAAKPVPQDDLLLYHKTTHRTRYEQAMAEVPENCEALLFNEEGCVTESSIANVVYELNGRRYTPPVRDGLLPGTLRGELVASGELQERSLKVGELGQIDALYLINALRGWRRARLMDYEATARGGRR